MLTIDQFKLKYKDLIDKGVITFSEFQNHNSLVI